ncbi:MAG: hypothetical protein HZB39_18620 [Planctomycetes bacterium]|nr:hypothetical protein [Planctomycetota bacterium]
MIMPEVRGIGVATPIGVSVPSFWTGATRGRCAIQRDAGFERAGLRSQVCARVDEDELRASKWWRTAWTEEPRHVQLALVAAAEACEPGLYIDSTPSRRLGLVFSTAMGRVDNLETGATSKLVRGRTHARHAILGDALAREFDISGPVIGISDGCTGGLDAFITACEMIEDGDVDACLTVASDAPLATLTMAAMDNLGVLSRRNDAPELSCLPFDRARQGMVMAEAAGALFLCGGRPASSSTHLSMAVVRGHASVSNCRSMVSLRDAAADMARCARGAMLAAGVSVQGIDHLNLHGSGTRQNDEAEGAALREVFGDHLDRIPAIAIKSLTGHGLAASNTVELVAEVMVLQTGLLPPARGRGSDNPWGVRLVTGEAAHHRAVTGLKMNHGFGGFHSCVILSRP